MYTGIMAQPAPGVKPERVATAYRDALERRRRGLEPRNRRFAFGGDDMTARNPDNVLRFRVQRASLTNLDALARDLGVSRADAARVALGVGLVGLTQVRDAAARPERAEVA